MNSCLHFENKIRSKNAKMSNNTSRKTRDESVLSDKSPIRTVSKSKSPFSSRDSSLSGSSRSTSVSGTDSDCSSTRPHFLFFKDILLNLNYNKCNFLKFILYKFIKISLKISRYYRYSILCIDT